MIQLARIAYTDKELQLLARLMRAEAEGEGKMGMLLVGNVCVNRAVANCLDFKKINTVEKAVMQKPGGFEATSKGYFYQAARSQDKKLAKRILEGEKFHPATNALWFYNHMEKNVEAPGGTNNIVEPISSIAFTLQVQTKIVIKKGKLHELFLPKSLWLLWWRLYRWLLSIPTTKHRYV